MHKRRKKIKDTQGHRTQDISVTRACKNFSSAEAAEALVAEIFIYATYTVSRWLATYRIEEHSVAQIYKSSHEIAKKDF